MPTLTKEIQPSGLAVNRQFTQKAAPSQLPPTIAAIDKLFRKIDFETEEEAIRPRNAQKIQKAFEKFMEEAGLVLSSHSFAELLREKSGPYKFRDDGITPNYFHELRESLQILTLVRNQKLAVDVIDKNDGLDVLLASTLRHDSFEDHGKRKSDVIIPLQEKVEEMRRAGRLSAGAAAVLNYQAEQIALIVDLLSRKEAKRDEHGQILRDPETGKIIKEVRHNGDQNSYYNGLLKHPFAGLIKHVDSVEGMSTRIMTDMLERLPDQKFSVASNVKYANERRSHYGRRNTLAITSRKYPQFENVLSAIDGMLGVNVVMLETVNDYWLDKDQNPVNASPVNIGQYTETAEDGYKGMPRWARPDLIMTRRLEQIAGQNQRMRDVLTYAIYPAAESLVGKRTPSWLKLETNSASMSEWTRPDF